MSGMVAYLFDRSEDAVEAVRCLRAHDHEGIDVLSAYHLEELDELLPTRPNRISWVVFSGAAIGATSAYALQYITAVILFPFEVAGTPHHAWPAFLPLTFELGVLLAALSCCFGVLFFCGLPRYHHRVFEIPDFERLSADRFAVIVETDRVESVDELLQARGLGGSRYEI